MKNKYIFGIEPGIEVYTNIIYYYVLHLKNIGIPGYGPEVIKNQKYYHSCKRLYKLYK